jgi:hypothetical protein
MNSKQALDILKKNDPINRMNLLTAIPLSGFHCNSDNVISFPWSQSDHIKRVPLYNGFRFFLQRNLIHRFIDIGFKWIQVFLELYALQSLKSRQKQNFCFITHKLYLSQRSDWLINLSGMLILMVCTLKQQTLCTQSAIFAYKKYQLKYLVNLFNI